MQIISIAIDTNLLDHYGPEICWAWRQVFVAAGVPWRQVSIEEPACDIAYTTEARHTDRSRLCILAKPARWEQPSRFHLQEIGHCEDWHFPVYTGERAAATPLQAIDQTLLCERDIIFDLFWLATGQEEAAWPKNEHGHFDLSGTAFYDLNVLRLAPGSGIISGLEKVFHDLGFVSPVPKWPGGRRAAACVGHDVDYPEVIRWIEPLRRLLHRRNGGLPAVVAILTGKRKHWHFASWVELEEHLQTRSAFFFTARQGSLVRYATGTPDPFYDVRSPRFKELFEALRERGFEIGLHASYHAGESREKLAAERELLAEASQEEIAGNRHHYWRMNPHDPESTLLLHEQVGFKYDTSLTHERYLGWRRGLCSPFFPFHQKERRELRTLQIPTAWMDDQLFGHRDDNPGERQEILHELADGVVAHGGCLLVDVHDYVFDEVLYPGWAQTYRDLWEYILTRSDIWIDTPGNIAEHWIKRHHVLLHASQGLTGAPAGV